MNKEFLQWLEYELSDAREARDAGTASEDVREYLKNKVGVLLSVKEKVQDILYKEAME